MLGIERGLVIEFGEPVISGRGGYLFRRPAAVEHTTMARAAHHRVAGDPAADGRDAGQQRFVERPRKARQLGADRDALPRNCMGLGLHKPHHVLCHIQSQPIQQNENEPRHDYIPVSACSISASRKTACATASSQTRHRRAHRVTLNMAALSTVWRRCRKHDRSVKLRRQKSATLRDVRFVRISAEFQVFDRRPVLDCHSRENSLRRR